MDKCRAGARGSLAILTLAVALCGQTPPDAARPVPRSEPPAVELPTDLLQRAERACMRGALALAALQDPREGSYRLGNAPNPAPIAIAALSTLALLSTGEVPGRTPRGRHVELGIRYLLDNQDRSRGPAHGYFGSADDRYSKMHGHGYATLALAQVLGQVSPRPEAIVTQKEAREALESAVRLIERCQDENTGGWYYDPVPRDHEGSITICMAQALRAARNAGILVDREVIRRAVSYVERSQKPDGSFRYQLGSEKSSVALTAAAVMTLNASGEYDNPVLLKGLAFLTDSSHLFETFGRMPIGERFPFYERLYVGEALFTARDREPFIRWYSRIVPELEGMADPDTGAWVSDRYGTAYGTAMTVLLLSLPLQYLPIHQR